MILCADLVHLHWKIRYEQTCSALKASNKVPLRLTGTVSACIDCLVSLCSCRQPGDVPVISELFIPNRIRRGMRDTVRGAYVNFD